MITEHKYWLYSKEQIIDLSYGKEWSLDCLGVMINFSQSESNDHEYSVSTDEGDYLCRIDDRDTVPEIRETIEKAVSELIRQQHLKITTTKRIAKSGNSYSINITMEMNALKLKQGDFVEVTIKPVAESK